MAEPSFDPRERNELCVLFDELGPDTPTLLEGWTAHDIATHIVLRSTISSRPGPPPGFFCISWVRSHPNLNEFFVLHEDVRRASGLGPRALTHELESALWKNIRRGSRYLSRRLSAAGLEIEWEARGELLAVRRGAAHRSPQRHTGSCFSICSAGRWPPEWTSAGRRSGPCDSLHPLRYVNRSARRSVDPRRADSGSTGALEAATGHEPEEHAAGAGRTRGSSPPPRHRAATRHAPPPERPSGRLRTRRAN